MTNRVEIFGLSTLPEIAPGDDLATLVLDACRRESVALEDGDVLVVTQKIISKAENRVVSLSAIEPSLLARDFAAAWGKDARLVELALRQARRIVKMDRGILITETRHGLVCANSGVDASNVATSDAATLLPERPDESAGHLRRALSSITGKSIAVVVSDTFGRPWREGVVNVAIGASGLEVLADYRGRTDPAGRRLTSTVVAIADEIAGAAELVMGKLDRIPVAVVRGYAYTTGDRGAGPLIRDPEMDLFR